MFFKQFYLGCLAHASYLIGSEGQAVVEDHPCPGDAFTCRLCQRAQGACSSNRGRNRIWREGARSLSAQSGK